MNTSKNHIDFKKFRDYYTNKLSVEEKAIFEKEINEDSFAKEAFEGFLILENDFDRISFIENANMEFKKKVGLETKTAIISLKPILAIAASLVLFIASYFIIQLNNTTPENFAENKTSSSKETLQKTIEEPIKKEISEQEKTVISDTDIIIVEQNILEDEAKSDLIPINTNSQKDFTEKKKTDFKTQKKENNKQISAEDFDLYRKQNDTEKDKKVLDETTEYLNAEVSNNKSEKNYFTSPTTAASQASTNTILYNDADLEEPKNTSTLTDYKKGIVAYNQSEYSKAIKFFNNSLDKNQSINSSNYFLGMTYFNQNKATKAIKYFDKVINSSSNYKERAKWYKSLSLINKGKRSEAIFLLKEIANSNSTFKKIAEKKLEDL